MFKLHFHLSKAKRFCSYSVFTHSHFILFGKLQHNIVRHCILLNFSTKTEKVHLNIGTIGHIDHGKTTLTAAISQVLHEHYGSGTVTKFDDIDKAPEEKKRGITINTAHVQFITPTHHYAHTDCPGHIDYIKNMITGASQMDGAILVVAATEGCMPQTREHLLLAKQIGIEKLIVFLNKADLVDSEMLQLAELEIQELLQEYGYDANSTPIVSGSALCALNQKQDDIGKDSILKLMNTADNYFTAPQRNITSPFIMPVENSITIPGRGTVAIGTVQKGQATKNTKMEVLGFGKKVKASIADMQVFKKSVAQCQAGDNVGLLLRGVSPDEVVRGTYVTAANSADIVNYFEASMYLLTKSEGGRSKPITGQNYIQIMYANTWSLASLVKIPDDKQMIMPGDHFNSSVALRLDMLLRPGDRFTIRENQITTITGVVLKTLPAFKEQVIGFNYNHLKPMVIQSGSSSVINRRR